MQVPWVDITELPDAAAVETVRRRAAGRARRQGLGAAHRRAQLLDAALELVLERGVDGLRMRELGLRCGYTAGALYAYFDSREALLGQLRERLLLRWTDQLRSLAGSRRQDLPERLQRQCALAWQLLADTPNGLPLITGPWPAQDAVMPQEPLGRLLLVLRPCHETLVAMGLDEALAWQGLEQALVWGIGRLVLAAPPPPAHAVVFAERLRLELDQLVRGTGPALAQPDPGQASLF